jgi:hypothetical protein
MNFEDVLKDMAGHVIEEANMKFEAQRKWHNFLPFTCERQCLTEGGSTFRIKVEFEPNPSAALDLAVSRN